MCFLSFVAPNVQRSHLSLHGEDGVSFLGVKVLYQETLEVIFYSFLDLCRLYTCSHMGKKYTFSNLGLKVLKQNDNELGSLLQTHLDEPLSQQINSLCHSRVVFREKLDDMLWRTTCLEIPAMVMVSYCHSDFFFEVSVQKLEIRYMLTFSGC